MSVLFFVVVTVSVTERNETIVEVELDVRVDVTVVIPSKSVQNCVAPSDAIIEK